MRLLPRKNDKTPKSNQSERSLAQDDTRKLRKASEELAQIIAEAGRYKKVLVTVRDEAHREVESFKASLESLKSEHSQRLSTLASEVERLEARRKEALRPIDEENRKLMAREKQVLMREDNVAVREKEVFHNIELIKEKANEIARQEQDLIDAVNNINETQEELSNEEEALAREREEFQRVKGKEYETINSFKVGLREEREEARLEMETAKAIEKICNDRMERLNKQEKEQQAILDSRRAALNAAIAEYRRKGFNV